MIGADELIKLRREGNKPFWVRVFVGDDRIHMAKEWHKWEECQDDPIIDIDSKENIEALDFRFAYQMLVILTGSDPDKLLKVYEKLTKVNPARLIMFYGDSEVEILDSKGLLSGIID